MISFDDNLKITIVVLLFVSYFLYEQKPEIMFDKQGKFKSFGLRREQTIFPFHIAIIVISFFVYYGLLLRNGMYV